MKSDLPIAFFDSGVGGLTIMKEVTRLLPNENFIYLADTAHLPYGERSPEEIIHYTIENSIFLLNKKIKLLIISCHTASSYALKILEKILPISVLGVIDAGFQELSHFQGECNQKKSHLAILGTTRTIESGVYQSFIQENWKNTKVFPVSCPLFVPLIEEGNLDEQIFLPVAEEYLGALKKKKIDLVFLGCTHYPLIRNHIQTVLGSQITLVDPAKRMAYQVYDWLKNNDLFNREKEISGCEFYTTLNPDKFSQLARLFLNYETCKVHLC